MPRKRRMPKSKALKPYFYKDENGDVQKKETSIEKTMRLILNEMSISYVQEFEVTYKSKRGKKNFFRVYDFLLRKEEYDENNKLIKYDILIEVHGDYFHAAKVRVKNYHLILEALNESKLVKKGKPRKKVVRKPSLRLNRMQQRNIINDKKKEAIAKAIGIPLVVIWGYELRLFPNQVRRKVNEEIQRQIKQYNHES